MSIEGQGHFFAIYFPGFVCFNFVRFTRPRHQVSVKRIIGPLVINMCSSIVPYEPRCEKIGLRGFRPGPTQTELCSHFIWLEARNFGFNIKGIALYVKRKQGR